MPARDLDDAYAGGSRQLVESVNSAIGVYTLQFGAPPERLEALVDPPDGPPLMGPTALVDHFGYPLVYVRRPAGSDPGWLLYSVGLDGIDGTADDIVATAHRGEHAGHRPRQVRTAPAAK